MKNLPTRQRVTELDISSFKKLGYNFLVVVPLVKECQYIFKCHVIAFKDIADAMDKKKQLILLNEPKNVLRIKIINVYDFKFKPHTEYFMDINEEFLSQKDIAGFVNYN